MSNKEKEVKKAVKLLNNASYKAKEGLFLKVFISGKIVKIDDKKGIEKLELSDLSYESRIELKRAVNLGHVEMTGGQ